MKVALGLGVFFVIALVTVLLTRTRDEVDLVDGERLLGTLSPSEVLFHQNSDEVTARFPGATVQVTNRRWVIRQPSGGRTTVVAVVGGTLSDLKTTERQRRNWGQFVAGTHTLDKRSIRLNVAAQPGAWNTVYAIELLSIDPVEAVVPGKSE